MDMTDGTPHEPFFRPLFELARDADEDIAVAERDLGHFLVSGRICERTEDDKTLIVAVRTGEG
jgi:hypothetical protein